MAIYYSIIPSLTFNAWECNIISSSWHLPIFSNPMAQPTITNIEKTQWISHINSHRLLDGNSSSLKFLCKVWNAVSPEFAARRQETNVWKPKIFVTNTHPAEKNNSKLDSRCRASHSTGATKKKCHGRNPGSWKTTHPTPCVVDLLVNSQWHLRRNGNRPCFLHGWRCHPFRKEPRSIRLHKTHRLAAANPPEMGRNSPTNGKPLAPFWGGVPYRNVVPPMHLQYIWRVLQINWFLQIL